MNPKKWNWKAFAAVMLFACFGAATNKSITSIKSFVILVSLVGIPVGLLFAIISRKD